MVEDMGEFGTGVTPPPPPGEQPAPSRSRSKARGAAAGIGVALVVGAGGIAVANAGSSTSAAQPGAAPTTEGTPPAHPGGPGRAGGPGGGRGFGGGLFGIGGGGGGVLHGTFTVDKSGGGYQTKQVQTGTVGSVSATSLQVTSKDGYAFTYVVKTGTNVDADRDGIASVKKGDEVVVTATVSGSTATVDRVADLTQLKKNMPAFAGGRGGPGFGHGGAPRSAPATPGTGT